MSGADVLIITALKEEFHAAQEAGLAGYGLHPGVSSWEDRDQATPTPYIWGRYVTANGSGFSVAVARPTRMGGIATSPVVSSLVDRLQPRCLAMSGVCAGNPAYVALGDVVVAEMAFAYDEGRRGPGGFEADHRHLPMSDLWVREAQGMSTADLPSFGPASDEDAKIWLMQRLMAGEDPRKHPACERYFPRNTWRPRLQAWKAAGLITQEGTSLRLTESGLAAGQQAIYEDLDGPDRLPFAVLVGPMASGNAVVKDGLPWDQLRQSGVRTVHALEMEAATIASIAHRLRVPEWVVAKGVMDHADPRKDDRFKRFAARASAEVLFKLLALRLAPDEKATRASRLRSVYVIGGVTEETAHPDFEATILAHFCNQLGESIARAGVELVVCSPFPDSADVHTVMGYILSGVGGTIHFHSPRHDRVTQKEAALLNMVDPRRSTRVVNWYYPAPENEDSWEQAWLLCQLQALENADAVISVGGRVSKTANTLLHLAEARRKPIVPFEFLGGASKRAFDRCDWHQRFPAVDHSVLRDQTAAHHALAIADRISTAYVRGEQDYRWPPGSAFISRARRDAHFADALADYLGSTDCEPVLGDHETRSNRMVQPAIEEAILRCDLFIALWSKSYALSRFCSDELEFALQRHRAGQLQLWIFNLDASDVVPRGARRLPQSVTKTPQELVVMVRELIPGH